MAGKPLLNGQGATHGHTCPQCHRTVASVAQSGEFGGYVPMPRSGIGSRKKPPLGNWLFYGTEGERFLICNGDWGKHYHHHGASFLWLKIETSLETGQMRLI